MKKTKKDLNKREKPKLFARASAAIAPRFTLECIERYELLVCGCRKIAFYSPEETVLCTNAGKVRVAGIGLKISFMGEGKIMLSGVISAIEFL